MKITLIGYGTRGDVQPMLALAWALGRRGHAVRLAAPINMRAWVEKASVPFVALPVDVQELFGREAAQRMLSRGDMASFFRWLEREERAYAAPMRRAVVEACDDAELIVAHPLMADRAAACGAARRVPVLPIYFLPLAPSRRFASVFITTKNLGPLNHLTHRLLLWMLWRASRRDVQTLRAELGIGEAHSSYVNEVQTRQLPCVMAYSNALFDAHDYGAHNLVTGSIVLPNELREALGERGLNGDLETFLERGPAPIFLGFGSMPVLDTSALLDLTRRVLDELDARAIIGAGWSDLVSADDPRVRVIGSVDHDALFPRCSAIVHHGGSGTIHASARAGVPSIVCSVFADQPFWGSRVEALGIGAALPFSKLDRPRLTAALRTAREEPTRARARELGERVAADTGLEQTIALIEERMPGTPPPL